MVVSFSMSAESADCLAVHSSFHPVIFFGLLFYEIPLFRCTYNERFLVGLWWCGKGNKKAGLRLVSFMSAVYSI